MTMTQTGICKACIQVINLLLSRLWTPILKSPDTRGYAEVKRVLLKKWDKIKALLSRLLSFTQNCQLLWKKALTVLAVVWGS